MISKDGILKIADFGLARGYGLPIKNYTHEVVTLWYRAPDVLLGSKNYFKTVDIWSVGCIFIEMITGEPLFAGVSEQDQLNKIFKIRGTPDETNYPDLKNLTEWNADNFNKYEPQEIASIYPQLDKDELELLEVTFNLKK